MDSSKDQSMQMQLDSSAYYPLFDIQADINIPVKPSFFPSNQSKRLTAKDVRISPVQGLDKRDMLYKLGMTCLEESDYEKALLHFNKLVQLDQNHINALYRLACCLFMMGRLELSLKCYKLALHIMPNHPTLLQGLAFCYRAQGDFDIAISLYEKMLKAGHANADCLFNLVLLGNYPLNSWVAEQLRKLHQSSNCSVQARIKTCFALGKIYEMHGEQKQGFAYYAEANRLQSSTFSYDEADMFKYFDTLQHTFNAKVFSSLKNVGISDATPIFVLGMPRSGTSLVEQILASHSQVHGAGEINKMPEIAMRLIPRVSGRDFPRAIYSMNTESFAMFAQHYLRGLRSHCPVSKPHIIDKMPNNYFNIGLIQLLFPNATIIHCVRDPMDTCWSIFRQYFNGMHPYAYDQKLLGRYYLRYQQLMEHWHTVLPGKIFDVHYEQLVENPEKIIPELLNHCNLPWDKECLSFHRTKRTVNTASMQQVRRPMYKSSLKSWSPITEELADLRKTLHPDSF